MSETYHIPGRISQQGHLLACPKCGRKILVEIALNGVSHNVSVMAVCAACLDLKDEFTQDHPDIAARLKEWGGTATKDGQCRTCEAAMLVLQELACYRDGIFKRWLSKLDSNDHDLLVKGLCLRIKEALGVTNVCS